MQKKIFINEQAFKKAQVQANSALHLYTILFLIFLIIYFIVGYIVVITLFDIQSYLLQYGIQACVELCLWCMISLFLWKGSKTGRILFTIFALGTCYAFYNFIGLFQYDMQDGIDKFIRFIFFFFFLCKCLTTFRFTMKLYQRPMIHVWECYDKVGKEAEKEDEQIIQQLLQLNDTQQQKTQSRKKIVRRALHNLRRDAILLFTILYGSILLFYLCMMLLHYLVVSDGNGMDYVGRYVLLASLFTAFVWSATAILLFLYKPSSKIAVLVAWLLEITRFIMTIQNTLDIFHSQHYGLPSTLALIIIEVIRYGLLLRFSILLFRDPFIQTYWKNHRIYTKT